jgi:aspartyl protease family protein
MRVAVIVAILTGVTVGLAWPGGGRKAVAEPPRAAAEGSRKTLLERSGSHFFVTAKVNGEPVHFVVDTGADITALTKEDARRAHIPYDESAFRTIARTASGFASGQDIHIDSIDLDGKVRADVGGIVLDGLEVSLLGQNFLRRLDAVEFSGDKMVLR